MPDYIFRNVTHYKSKSVSISEFRGKWLFLDLWSGGCMACVKTFSKIDQVQKKFKNDINWVLVADNGKSFVKEPKAIETLSKPDAARQQVEELQALVSQTLSLVADNGDIAKLGTRALDYSRGKQEQMRKDTKFSATERAALQRRWDRNVSEMTKATDELSKASNEFAQLLKIIQTRGDYAAEILEVENATEMVKVIQNLAGDVRGASETLKTFIRGLSPPDA